MAAIHPRPERRGADAFTLLVTPDRHGTPRDHSELARRAHRPRHPLPAGREHGAPTGQLRLPRIRRRGADAADEPRPAGRDESPAHEDGPRGVHPPELRALLAAAPPARDERMGAARGGAASRRADAPARLELLTARRGALRDAGGRARGPGDLAARLEARAPAVRIPGAGAADRRSAPARRTRRPLHSLAHDRRGESPQAVRVHDRAADARHAYLGAGGDVHAVLRHLDVARPVPRRARAGGRADAIRRPAVGTEHGARPAGSGRDGRAATVPRSGRCGGTDEALLLVSAGIRGYGGTRVRGYAGTRVRG